MKATFRALDLAPVGEAGTSFEAWLSALDVWGRLDPDRLAETVGVLLVVGLYYQLVRWARDRLVLTPFRDALRSDLDELGRRVARVDSADAQGLKGRIEALDQELVDDPRPWTGATLYRALLLRREGGRWLARADDAEAMRGRARIVAHELDDAHAWLREDLLAIAAGEVRLGGRERELVCRAVILTTPDDTAATAKQLTLHRKTNWLVLTGLGVIVLLTAAFGNAAIVTLGILGAFLSRISAFTRPHASNEFAFNWTTVVLSPVVGALAALAGVLVVQVLVGWQVLGEVVATVGWGDTSPQTLLVAFLLGFSERLLDSLVRVATERFGVPETGEAPLAADGEGGGAGERTVIRTDTDEGESRLDQEGSEVDADDVSEDTDTATRDERDRRAEVDQPS